MRTLLLFILALLAMRAPTETKLEKLRVNSSSFQTAPGKLFVPFGVTYYRPGTGWAPQVWKQFDAQATERDFMLMKAQGVNCVRVFLSYESFCSKKGILDPEGLGKFDRFLQIAEEAGIYVHPTGPDHWEGTPDWARVDSIADETALQGLEEFWRSFAARYRGRNVIFAYDLRNEPEVRWDTPPMRQKWNQWVQRKYQSTEAAAAAWKTGASLKFGELTPPEPRKNPETELLDYQLFREDIADEWTRRQVKAIKESDPDALVTVGLIQWSVPSLLPRAQHYAAFRPERQASFLDFMEVHFYPLDHGAYEYRGAEDEGRNLAYLESVVRAAAQPGKPLVLAEFGWYGGGKPKFDNGRHPAASGEQQARWCKAVVESTAGTAHGWLNWGFYDQPEAGDVSELTGLLTSGGAVKAWGKAFKELAERYAAGVPARAPVTRPSLNWNRAILDPAEGNRFREEYYQAWRKDHSAQSSMIQVIPRQTDELLANPGMGWQTFHHFADEDKNLAGLPSGSAYFRFYWREIEKKDGEIDFARFDQLLAHARRAGQRLAFRIMCTGSGEFSDVPLWLKEQGCKGFEFKYGGRTHWVPDFSDPLFKEKHFRLIRELGRRYNDHRDLDVVDIGSVGLWGEWHMSGTTDIASGKPVPLPSVELRQEIIDEWSRAFSKTPRVVLIGSEEGMRRAARDHLGWRADCMGDMGGFSKTWNHMNDFYLQQLERTGANDAWGNGPVAFESCWDMQKWKSAGWDIPFIFNYALRCHVSYMNNKSALIPEGTRGEVENFIRKMGYRLALRAVEHEPRGHSGGELTIGMEWENIGVAPPYRDYRLAVRLSNSKSSEPQIIVTPESIQGWMPGKKALKLSIPLPKSLPHGACALSLSIVDPATAEPAVRLPIEGRDQTGWYALSHFEVD